METFLSVFETLGWQFSLGFVLGVATGIALCFRAAYLDQKDRLEKK